MYSTLCPFFSRHHSQVVRQRPAKPLCPSSNLGGASNKAASLYETCRFFFAIFICLFSLSRHTCAGIFCFYLESGEVLHKKTDGSVLVSPRWEVTNQKKRYQGKSLIPFGAEGETRQGAALSVRCANDPILCPFLLRKKMDDSVLVSPGWEVANKKKRH